MPLGTGLSDYYKVLQVDREAEPEIIEAAYRRLARMYHPDVSREPSANQSMAEINRAYSVLSDPAQRRGYDERIARRARLQTDGPPSGSAPPHGSEPGRSPNSTRPGPRQTSSSKSGPSGRDNDKLLFIVTVAAGMALASLGLIAIALSN